MPHAILSSATLVLESKEWAGHHPPTPVAKTIHIFQQQTLFQFFPPLSVIWSPPNECNFWLIGFKMLIKHWHRGSRHQVSRLTAAFFFLFFCLAQSLPMVQARPPQQERTQNQDWRLKAAWLSSSCRKVKLMKWDFCSNCNGKCDIAMLTSLKDVITPLFTNKSPVVQLRWV